MKIAIVGLGKMGHQIVQKLLADGHQVIGYDQNLEVVDELAQQGITPAHSKAEVAKAFGDDQAVVWLMIPAQFIETELADWLNTLPDDSIIIDGGNSDYRLTEERADLVGANHKHFIDVGTSGGVHGLDNGFSLMVGGVASEFTAIEPVLKTLSQPHGGYQHVGPHGAGHFVKMVHNAIEYGIMQSLAEGYQLLHEGPVKNLNLAEIGRLWQQGSIIASNLNGLTAEELAKNPDLTGIAGVVAESGEDRWAIESAHAQGFQLPVLEKSLQVRLASQQGQISFATKLLAAMRNGFGGHNIQGKQ